MLAPVGSLDTFHPGAGVEAAKGAGDFGVPKMMSSVNKLTMAEVKAATSGPLVFQLYVRGDDAFIDKHVEEASAANYDAFCMTVDTAVYSRRERDIAKRFAKPWRTSATGQEFQAALSWKNVELFKTKHKMPLILKGIATAEDARIAIEHGVECVYVSNHGGRQLDHGRGSMDALLEIIDAVDGRAKLIVDGGFCRGTDIVKAMALGVEAIGIGRLYCYALTAAGAPGIVRMLEILEDEVHSGMGLSGVTNYGELDKSFLHFGAPSTNMPGVHSAFPLLGLDDPGYGGR
jgi:glycolate oxidase